MTEAVVREPVVTAPDVRTRGLTVRYYGRDMDALHGIDLEVAAGELLGVAGENGAGKSTLALALAGLIPRVIRAQVSGSVEVSPPDAHVGIVFSSPHNQISATKATVREELAFGLENLGVPRADMDARIDAALTALRIDHLADRFPFELSGGEQQRVAIASILVMGTQVLVLDEPTAQLDPASTRLVGELMREVAASGTAVIVAEHAPVILGEADRIAVLHGGRLVATGDPLTALGSATLGPIGLEPPTVVRLAELAGLTGARVPSDDELARGLRASAGRGDGSSSGRVAVPATTRPWTPVRSHPPTSIEVDDLTHRYANGVEALRGVSLRIAPGETVAIVGQNGSGKTTLAKHLNGLLRPASGEVRIGGGSLVGRRVDQIAGQVGFVFQDPDDQLFGRSVEREVAFGPRNLRLDAPTLERLVEAALAATGLAEERRTNPYDLDRSRRKLVALASILAMDPAVLVLDEPTTGQDASGVRRVGTIVEAFRDAGRTVVAITHDMELAARHFGRLVVMAAGRIVADGPPEEVFDVRNEAILASAGLVPPVAARVGAALGLGSTPTPEALARRLGERPAG